MATNAARLPRGSHTRFVPPVTTKIAPFRRIYVWELPVRITHWLNALAITVLPYIAYYQLANVLPVWLQTHADLNVGAFQIPIPWFYSIDPLASILSVPILFSLWNWQARTRGREPTALTKIAIGAFMIFIGNLIIRRVVAIEV